MITFGLEHARNPIDRDELHRILDELLDLRERTAQLDVTEVVRFRTVEGKDACADAAHAMASQLILQVAGWATNHRIGRAFADDSGKPVDLDDQKHERAGEQYASNYTSHSTAEAAVARAVLRAALGGTFWPLPMGLNWEMNECLTALEFGEARPLFRPVMSRLHGAAFTLAQLRLQAVEHVYFAVGKGIILKQAKETVAGEFTASSSTVTSWETRYLPKLFGAAEVKTAIENARGAGQLALRLERDPDFANSEKRPGETIDGAHWLTLQRLSLPVASLATIATAYRECLLSSPAED